uniref:Cadherin domain-containing protein n=1 Tax=Neolamprologus brichardi TaxID=32507 RepID=A0A3Q4M4G6_NEOBR
MLPYDENGGRPPPHPEFKKSVYEADLPENSSPGAPILQLKAADADVGNAEIAYSLDSSVNGIFSIDADSGDIRVNTILDRELTERYEFKVIAKDKGINTLQGSATVVVLVADKNDNEPKFISQRVTQLLLSLNMSSSRPDISSLPATPLIAAYVICNCLYFLLLLLLFFCYMRTTLCVV